MHRLAFALLIALAAVLPGAGRAQVLSGPPGATATGGTTWRPLSDMKGRDLLSVLDFGAKCDWNGTAGTDDSAAIQAAITAEAGGRLLVPAQCYVASKLQINSPIQIYGRGSGKSKIVGASALATVIQIGDATHIPTDVLLSGITVDRAGGTPPVGSIGIDWHDFGRGREFDVATNNHDIGQSCSADVGVSIDLTGEKVTAANSTTAYFVVNNCAGVYFTDTFWGKNGGESYTPAEAIEITGGANDVHFTNCELLPNGPALSNAAVAFNGYTNTTGIIEFTACTSEHTTYSFATDAGTAVVASLIVNGGRYAPSTDFFSQNAATEFDTPALNGVNIGTSVTLANEKWGRVNAFIGGALSVTGNGNDLTVGGIISGNAALAGTFGKLVFTANVLGTFTSSATATTSTIFKSAGEIDLTGSQIIGGVNTLLRPGPSGQFLFQDNGNTKNVVTIVTSAGANSLVVNGSGDVLTGNRLAATALTAATSNSVCYDTTTYAGKATFALCSSPGILVGTTASIGGSAVGAGACTSGTASVTGATTSHAVAAAPATYPGDGFVWKPYVSAAGTVTVKVCNYTSGSLTPTASAYNVRVIE